MTIDEAIKELGQPVRFLKYDSQEKEQKAHKLGIEALKRIQHQRKDLYRAEIRLLPGETKE